MKRGLGAKKGRSVKIDCFKFFCPLAQVGGGEGKNI